MESNPNTYRLTRENYNECSNLFKDYNKISRNENAKKKESIYVMADNFYIDQVATNYFTNAIKHVEEVDGLKQIKVSIEETENNKVRIKVFNTGKKIEEEDLSRIWKRFYKVDSSRNRDDGGTGIGLSLVKAIMNNYENKYGVDNKENGVEFYFDLDKA